MSLPEEVKSVFDKFGISLQSQVLVACSGGPDSIALLHCCLLLKIPFAVAHVNYRLRGAESDDDEAFVSNLCSRHRIPYYVHHCKPEEINPGQTDIQRIARSIRYAFFNDLVQKHTFVSVLTAHHRDDDLETYLMQKNRGSGVAVYPGICMASKGLLRPFLSVYKTDILGWLALAGYAFRTDSSNEANYYQRNKLRAELIQKNTEERAALFETLDSAKKEFAISSEAWENTKRRCVWEYDAFQVLSREESASEKTMAFGVNERMRQAGFNNHICRKIWNGFQSASHAMLFRSGRYQVEVIKNRIIQELKAPRLEAKAILPGNFLFGSMAFYVAPSKIPDFAIHPNRDPFSLYLSECLFRFPLYLSAYESGEKMQPFGMHGKKPVSEVLREAGIPLILRKHIPVLRKADGKILWIAGLRAAEETRATAGEDAWKISFQPSDTSVYAFLEDSVRKSRS